MMSRSILVMVVACLAFGLSADGWDSFLLERGRGAMGLKHVLEGDAGKKVGGISMPASFSADGVRYYVRGDRRWGEYELLHEGVVTNKIEVNVRFLANEYVARRYGFGISTFNNLPIRDAALALAVDYLDEGSNVLHLTTFGQRREFLLYKNVVLELSGGSNRVATAKAFLQASLVPRETVP